MKASRLLGFACALAVVCAPATAAIDREAADHYEQALERFHAGDLDTALIEAKNALQIERRYLPAEVLLGRVYVARGQPADAVNMLSAALERGADPSTILPYLGDALIAVGKPLEVLETMRPREHEGRLKAQVLVLHGRAHIALGALDDAAVRLREAAGVDPSLASPWYELAGILLLGGDTEGARDAAVRATELGPEIAASWNAEASVRHASGELDGALEGYGRALALEPTLHAARIARASLLLDLGRDDEALADLDQIPSKGLVDPRASYLRALIHARRGETEGTRAAMARTAEVVNALRPEYLRSRPNLLLIGGLSQYSLNQLARAEEYLRVYVALRPEHIGARKVLAASLLAGNDPESAVKVLEPVAVAGRGDPELLSMLADAHAKAGRREEATRILELVAGRDGATPEERTRLALSRLGRGDDDRAVAELAAVLRDSETHKAAGTALAVLHMKARRWAEAEQVLGPLVGADPENLTLLNMLATAQTGARRYDEARATLERAAGIDPDFMPAQLNLAKLDRLAGDEAAARRRYREIVEREPQETRAMMELADIERAAGREAESLRWLEKARSSNARAVAPRIALVDALLVAGEAKRALDVALEAEQASPEDLDALAALARVRLALGERQAARDVYGRMSFLVRGSPDALVRVAALQARARLLDGARETLELALETTPGHARAQIALADVLRATGDVPGAAERARAVRDAHPDIAAAHRALADAELALGRCTEALDGFGRASALEPSTVHTLRRFQAHLRCGDESAGIAVLESAAEDAPDNEAIRRALAEGYLRAGRTDAAITAYERILAAAPEDAAVLNNLAYLYGPRDDARALEYAERAHALAPASPAVTDTLGWLLVRSGDPARALPLLRDAQSRDSGNPEIRYHLAEALVRLGREDEAARELAVALASTREFSGRDEAEALRARLGK